MMTILFLSQTFASLPNSRLNTPMVPGPQTSCVMSTSAFTQMLSPAWTLALPAARARIFSVNVIVGRKYLMRGASSTAQAGLSERRLWTDVDGGASGQGRAGGGSRDGSAEHTSELQSR